MKLNKESLLKIVKFEESKLKIEEIFGDTKDLSVYEFLKRTKAKKFLSLIVDIMSNNLELCKLLVKFRVDPKMIVATGIMAGAQAIHIAVWNGQEEIVKYLLDKGVDVDVKDLEEGMSPLHLAAKSNNLEITKYLHLKDANLNSLDHSGNTPLKYSENWGSKEVYEYLSKIVC